MTLNGEISLILRYFSEFGNDPYFALFHRIRVRCDVVVKQLLGLPRL